MSANENLPRVIAPPVVAAGVSVTPAPTGRKRRRWWIYALGTLGGLFVLGLATLVGLGIYWNSLIKTYTSTTAKPIPQLEATPQEFQALGYRIKQFRESLPKYQSLAPLEFSSRDVNLLLAQNREMKDRVWLVVTNGRLEGEFSFPLDRIGWRGLQGRHLNGTVSLAAGLLEDGFLMLKITEVKVNGKNPPAWILRRLMMINFMDPMNNQRETLFLLPNLQSIALEDGVIRITPVEPRVPDLTK